MRLSLEQGFVVLWRKHNQHGFPVAATDEVYSRFTNSWTPQRSMLARLAAHINQGQLAVAGLGVGGEGAIVIDDNCTVGSVDKYRRLRQC